MNRCDEYPQNGCGNEAYFAVARIIKGDKGDKGERGEKGDGIKVYLTEFTIVDLLDGSTPQCDTNALKKAIDEGNIIGIPYGEGEGYSVADAYYEDLIYVSVLSTGGKQLISFDANVGDTTINPDAVRIYPLGEYAPMVERFNEYTSHLSIAPNSSAVLINQASYATIYLEEPSDFSKTTEYSLIIRNFGEDKTIVFDKEIIWANDSVPDLLDVEGAVLEINIKCVSLGQDGVKYLGTWVKYTV